MYRTWIIAVAAAISIAGASRADAQSAATAPVAAEAPIAVGPTQSAAALSPMLALADAPAVSGAAAGESFARRLTNGQKLMILGGAILLTGAIVGGDAGTIIMIGGGAVGIYGLYLQLGQPGMTEARVGLERSF
ncbi:MAG TPA: hypothetical protein VF041_19540 [Gemmatimonadaceae bacterium]